MNDIKKLGRYDIIRVLGKGAMGVVYEGRDPNLDRVVAIKTIRVQSLTPAAATEYEGRFRTEARSAARLHHPNIVSVFDSGQDDGIAYLVMEFIQGEDLKQHLECGARFSVRSSIVMLHELLMALDHAHRQNVVHRDIKPANMLMEVSGRIKLTDFGVARIQEPDETNLTQVGGAVGTPKYMSPEQAKGLRGDSRSDVFSAGVVLYELLTGSVPFTGDNQFIVIHQIVSHQPASPSSLNPEVPPEMDEVIARAMAKNPDERYATAREFAMALRAVAQQMNATTGTQGADVGAELGQFLANRPESISPTLRDGSSTGIFGPSLEASLNSTVNHEAEMGAWNEVKDSTNPKDFLDFLARFPQGIYAHRAQGKVHQLGAGDAFQGAKTQPHYRPPASAWDLDSTVGATAAPGPQRMPEPVAANSKLATPMPAIEGDGKPVQKRKTGLLLAGVAGLGCIIALVFMLKPGAPVEQEAKPIEAPLALASAPATIPEPTPALPSASGPASAPTVTPSAAASVPALRTASAALAAPSRPASKPRVNPVSASASAPLPQPSAAARPTPVQASTREAIPVAVGQVQGKENGPAPGPSMPGQACVDRVFVFKIACIAEQCMTDRYRNTAECVRFKEMERQREEERNSRR